jgi:two-component system, NarL family, nitrate/nitrite response regulator NarL
MGADADDVVKEKSTVTVAIKNNLLRLGIEQMLPETGPAGGRILIVLLSEIDDSAATRLRAAEAAGSKVMLLLDKEDDVAELSRTGTLGIRGAGFLAVDNVSEDSIADTLSRMERDELPIPGGLARELLTLASERAAPARPKLTPREAEALELMVEGLSNKQIARRLEISEHGAKRLVANILAKLDCANRTLAVAKALREGLHNAN